MARPQKDAANQRDQRLNPRFTAGERMTVEANAAFYGVTPTEWVRRCALSKRLPASKANQQTAAVRNTALIRIGNNLNQLTRPRQRGLAARKRAAADAGADQRRTGPAL